MKIVIEQDAFGTIGGIIIATIEAPPIRIEFDIARTFRGIDARGVGINIGRTIGTRPIAKTAGVKRIGNIATAIILKALIDLLTEQR